MAAEATERTLEKEMRLNQLYLAIISRYKDYIEEMEHISVAELPSLIMPKNEMVMKKADDIKKGFGVYNYKINFYEASINAFYFIKNSIEDAALPLQFWLTPEETLTFGIGDVMDRNILLASLLIDLGNPSAKVLVCVKDSVRKIFTYYEFDGKAYVLDFSNGFKKFASRDEIIKSLDMNDETIAYEFNDQIHTEIN